jgi:hypothetical protein
MAGLSRNRWMASISLGVKGSPVQIRPSRSRSEAGSGLLTRPFGLDGSARTLPSVAQTKWCGVSCRMGTLTSGLLAISTSARWLALPPHRLG